MGLFIRFWIFFVFYAVFPASLKIITITSGIKKSTIKAGNRTIPITANIRLTTNFTGNRAIFNINPITLTKTHKTQYIKANVKINESIFSVS